jgi:hypothetical protein
VVGGLLRVGLTLGVLQGSRVDVSGVVRKLCQKHRWTHLCLSTVNSNKFISYIPFLRSYLASTPDFTWYSWPGEIMSPFIPILITDINFCELILMNIVN